ncbi:hypothetical protein C5167_035479 [Papaver somniferum]|uniref:Uncharacterized protein n=1 Tax=Papaver somniferum TaxID=3469 RepID=A0A4Y7KJR8_PAPSO|nr:hypothetical protein C5167_035479 [Papaver somniferum]
MHPSSEEHRVLMPHPLCPQLVQCIIFGSALLGRSSRRTYTDHLPLKFGHFCKLFSIIFVLVKVAPDIRIFTAATSMIFIVIIISPLIILLRDIQSLFERNMRARCLSAYIASVIIRIIILGIPSIIRI